MKHRIVILLLTAALLAVFAASCASEPDKTDSITTAPAETAQTESAETALHDDLPALDYGGETVGIFCTDYETTLSFQYIYADAENGDVVNDALYLRNLTVAERLNVKLAWTEFDFDWSTRDLMYTAINTSVLSGDTAYSILLVPTYFNSTLITRGLLADIGALPYVDFGKPWWSQLYIDAATINGKTYMAAGDGVLPYITGISCLAFNKDFAETYDMGNLYRVAEDGKWTLDYMNDAVRKLYVDVNGDQTADESDQYGMVLLGGNSLSRFAPAIGIRFIERNNDTFEYVAENELNATAYDQFFSFLHENEGVCFINENLRARTDTPFAAGRSLLTSIQFNDTVYFRDLNFSYGILPTPKLDEKQESYYAKLPTGTAVFCVSATSAGEESVGAVLEAMSAEGYKTLTPAYFEVALKIKYASDDETSNMLDLIKSVSYMDIAEIYSTELGAPFDLFKNTVSSKNNSGVWASTMAKSKEAVLTKIDGLLNTIKSLS